MAKDGSLRGGTRPGSGPKRKPLNEKIADGGGGHHPLTVIDFGDRTAELEGRDMPKPSEFLSDEQADGTKLDADKIYEDTWNWLSERGCSALVSSQMIERYAMAEARWEQCEKVTSQLGFLAKHPTTGEPMQSPYVAIADKYMTQANRIWAEIFQIVRENCSTDYKGSTPHDDVMEQLLRARKG